MIETVKLILPVLHSDRRGVTAVEYALVAGALVLGIGAAFAALTGSLTTYLSNLAL